MVRRGFGFGGHTFWVEGDAEPMRWLQEFVEPQFGARDAGTPDETIRFVVDPEAHARLLACGPHPQNLSRACVTLDSGIVSGRVWQAPDAAEVVLEEPRGVFYRRPPHESRVVEVIAARDTDPARVGLMRVLREYAMLYASRAGWLLLHAAAVSVGEDTFVIPGPKKAGKTTLLLHALCNEGGTYLSNDRVALQIAQEMVTVHGIPTIMSIRLESTTWLPGLASKLAGVRSGFGAPAPPAGAQTDAVPAPPSKLNLSPAELCASVGARSEAAAEVTALVYPEVGAAHGGACIEALGTEQALDALRGAVFRSCPADGMFRSAGAVAAMPGSETAAQIVARVPSFRCRLGPDAYHDRWLSKLRLPSRARQG